MPDLMYMDEPVLSFKEVKGEVTEITRVTEPKFLPFYLSKNISPERMNEWRRRRQIPETREGIKELKKKREKLFSQKSYASLADPYWIRYRYEKWKDVNFFMRLYSPVIGDLVFKPYQTESVTYKPDLSPDLSTIGVLRKCWRQYDGKNDSYLLKAGSVKYHHEPLSEVLSSVILEKLGLVKAVKYDLAVEGVEMCSKCKNFVKQGEELITAVDFYYDKKREDTETVYEHLVEMCKENGIEHARSFIDKMTFVDVLLGNTDRNLSNIGFIRDVKNGVIKPAPLYDNGTAFFGENNIKHDHNLKFVEEKKIFKKVVRDADIKALKDDKTYEDIIKNYPGIDKETADRVTEEIEGEFHNLWKGKKRERVAEFDEIEK